MAACWRSHLDRQSVEHRGSPPSVSDCIPGGDKELTAQTAPYLHNNRPTPREESHSLQHNLTFAVQMSPFTP